MCCMRLSEKYNRMQKIAKNSPSPHHHTTLSGCIFTTKACINNWKTFVKQQYLLHMSSQYDELQPTNSCDWFASLGQPANFNRFCILVSLLHQRHSMEVNQTLHGVWPSSGLVHYIYISGSKSSGGSCPLTEFWQVQNSLCIQILHSPIGLLAALLHGTRAVGVSQALRHSAEDATYVRQGGHHVGQWPTF